jgi:hypothetical protein
MQGYYVKYRPRLADSLRVAYATSWQEVDEIADRYGADVVLSGPSVWTSTQYDAGFKDLMDGLSKDGAARRFVLREPPPERILFRSGETFVVRVGSGAALEPNR